MDTVFRFFFLMLAEMLNSSTPDEEETDLPPVTLFEPIGLTSPNSLWD